MTATALIIDDEPDIRELLAMTLSRMGLDFHAAANLDEARHLMAEYQFDVCLTDMRLPDGNGVDFVRYIQSKQPGLPVAVITAHGNMEAAVEAMKNGAYDFVSKPIDIQQLRQLVAQAVATHANNTTAPASNDPLHEQTDAPINKVETNALNDSASSERKPEANLQELSHRAGHKQSNALVSDVKLIGTSEAMQAVRAMIAKLARTNAPVWITGESGTGKELIARLIHENSARNDKPFVAINCGAIPSELMESEFFGHKKGSFTGATMDNDGLFRSANGGTLFLDEVAELPLHMQVKLLRAIQERSIRPVGSNEESPIDARILSASHKDLAAEVEAGRFRHDLYYRLNVISLTAPPLRTRSEDIPQLCNSILAKITGAGKTQSPCSIDFEALHALQQYPFPGNVRELENILERAVAMIDGNTILATDLNLPDSDRNGNAEQRSVSGEKRTNDEQRIVQALNQTRWNRKEAAQLLGLTYRQLRYRIKQLGIDKGKGK